MSVTNYRCTRCGKTAEVARQQGCWRGPCPMQAEATLDWWRIVFFTLLITAVFAVITL